MTVTIARYLVAGSALLAFCTIAHAAPVPYSTEVLNDSPYLYSLLSG
jgi:hypothetical protein